MRSRCDPQEYCSGHFKTEAPAIRRIHDALVFPKSGNPGGASQIFKTMFITKTITLGAWRRNSQPFSNNSARRR